MQDDGGRKRTVGKHGNRATFHYLKPPRLAFCVSRKEIIADRTPGPRNDSSWSRACGDRLLCSGVSVGTVWIQFTVAGEGNLSCSLALLLANSVSELHTEGEQRKTFNCLDRVPRIRLVSSQMILALFPLSTRTSYGIVVL
ncbi:hypothetical protein BDV98DRAFT_570693 [Pterulicium gracile]|uniref:Uncharacterized protein n=1 Tax=Pterulicium gracile TaxID=1884261 RepID=A0A5C3QEZ5_9AGAR|nr:hypothetical protein BDV98DRAFT_570693 [Pterula gracilis]